MEQGLRHAFAKVREEMDDHLDTINQNTNEIQSLYDYLGRLEGQMDKLSERLDELSLADEFNVAPLSYREQEVFLCIYTADGMVTANDIASRTGLTMETVHRCVAGLSVKGVPLLQQGDAYSMELRFKDAQAREQIVLLDERVVRDLQQPSL